VSGGTTWRRRLHGEPFRDRVRDVWLDGGRNGPRHGRDGPRHGRDGVATIWRALSAAACTPRHLASPASLATPRPSARGGGEVEIPSFRRLWRGRVPRSVARRPRRGTGDGGQRQYARADQEHSRGATGRAVATRLGWTPRPSERRVYTGGWRRSARRNRIGRAARTGLFAAAQPFRTHGVLIHQVLRGCGGRSPRGGDGWRGGFAGAVPQPTRSDASSVASSHFHLFIQVRLVPRTS
jgi:hypothetical protein